MTNTEKTEAIDLDVLDSEFDSFATLSFKNNTALLKLAREQREEIADHEEVHGDKRRIVREFDQWMNGDGAAKQAALIDVLGQIKRDVASLRAENEEMRTMLIRCTPSIEWHMHEASSNQQDELEFDLADIHGYLAALLPDGEGE